jgi:tetratricopeptide (TPR) repeat protein
MRLQTSDPDDPAVAATLVNLAVVVREQGDFEEAYSLLSQALDLQRRIFGPEHPPVAATLVNLADVAEHRGDFDEAYGLLSQALDLQRRIFGPEHPTVAATLVNLADVAEHRGDLHEAYGLLLQALETSKLTSLESHADELDWDSIYEKARHIRQALDAAAENAGEQP